MNYVTEGLCNQTLKSYRHLLYLRHGVELDHGSSKRLSVGTQRGNEAQHGTVKGSINLCEGGRARIVHIDHRNMTQEPTNNMAK